jgi:hypothetical protein
MTDRLLKCVTDAAQAPAFKGPDQRSLAAMMAQLRADPQ